MKEVEGNFDKAWKVLNIIDIASIIAGGLLGLPGLVGGGLLGQSIDQSFGKETSRWLKKRNKK